MRNFMMWVIISIYVSLCIGCGGHLSKKPSTYHDVSCTLTVSKKIIIPKEPSDFLRVGLKLHDERGPISVAFDVCYLDNKIDDKLPIKRAKFSIQAVAPMVSVGYRF